MKNYLFFTFTPYYQEVCQTIEGCNYFTYDEVKQTCFLFHYRYHIVKLLIIIKKYFMVQVHFLIIYVHFRYLDSCQVIGGLATPVLDACHEEIQDSCTSFKREDCVYSGTAVYNRTSVNNAHSCQSLLSTIGYVYGGVYFVYDSLHHTCTFYDSVGASCSAFSGPDLPDLDSCNLH